MPTRGQLLHSAESLCNDFSLKKDADILLSHFSSTYQCTAIEHGDPSLAPFLGKTYDMLNPYFSFTKVD
jgi:hypothetical protein